MFWKNDESRIQKRKIRTYIDEFSPTTISVTNELWPNSSKIILIMAQLCRLPIGSITETKKLSNHFSQIQLKTKQCGLLNFLRNIAAAYAFPPGLSYSVCDSLDHKLYHQFSKDSHPRLANVPDNLARVFGQASSSN